jgi:hypothetical protein
LHHSIVMLTHRRPTTLSLVADRLRIVLDL